MFTTFDPFVACDLGTTSFFEPFFPYCCISCLLGFSLFPSDQSISVSLLVLPSLPDPKMLVFLKVLSFAFFSHSRLSFWAILLAPMTSIIFLYIDDSPNCNSTFGLYPELYICCSFSTEILTPQGILTKVTLKHVYFYLCRAF